MSEGGRRIETRTIHAGQEPDEETGTLVTPIRANSMYVQDEPGGHRSYECSRTGNPMQTDLESNLAALERDSYGRAFASGMGSIDTALNLLEAGNYVVAGNGVYGGTHRIFIQVYEKCDLRFDFVDATDRDAVHDVISGETELVWVETSTNPLMRVSDIGVLADIAREADVLYTVDGTFATPYLQRLLDHGANIVSHSLTKYLGGRSGIAGGALITGDEELDEKLDFHQSSVDATPSPFDCFLVLRGTKTLPARMDRHCDDARDLVAWLDDHETVSEVFYSGLDSHPQHDLAAKQMDNFGGMLSFELDGPLEQASAVVEETGVLTLAEGLDGVESLIEQPATITRTAIPRKERLEAGLIDGLIRVSVGIKHIDDVKADLQRAFDAAF